MIVGEFGMRDFVSPGTRVGSAEDPKVRFNLLVDTFCFAVGLGVIGGGEGEVVVEEFPKFFGEGGGELWTSIGDDLVVESEAEIYFVEKEGGYSLGSDGFLGRAENYPLCKAMVDHDQQRVKARGNGEVGDQVTRDLLEGARGVQFDRGQRGDGGVRVRFVLLARGAAFDVFSHKVCETQPPELRGNKLASFQVTGVTGSLVVVAAGEDGATEGILWGDVDTTLVGQDVVVEFPVGEAGPEGSGDVLQGRL